MTDTSPLTPDQFVSRYGKYFNLNRVEAIQNLGVLFVEGPANGP